MSPAGLVTVDDLRAEFREVTGIEEAHLNENLEKALKAACDDGFFKPHDALEHYHVNKNTVELVKKFREQYNVLVATFRDQIKIDFKAKYPQLRDSDLAEISNAVIETINGIFSERGIEVVNMVFTGKQPRLVGAAALFRMVMTSARRLQRPAIQYTFVRYITNLLSAILVVCVVELSFAPLCPTSMSVEGKFWAKFFSIVPTRLPRNSSSS